MRGPRLSDALSRLRRALSDRYEIEREIGSGGSATVYLAQDLKHGRPAAVKVLDVDIASAVSVERFLREIRFAARLHHPNILPLYDSGEAGGSLFYVMPFVAGESLRQRLERDKQLSLGDAVRIAGEVAAALDYAHGQGVVHRDIKPENILLDDGRAVVADFGVARAIVAAGDEKLTRTGLAVGTPGYMSPEQATGSGHVDGRSDVYSLGCVTYEMLAGNQPFPGSTPQAIIARHLADPVPPLRTVRRSVPLALEQAVLRALEKVPADRFGTAGEFAAALQAPAAEEPGRRRWVVRGLVAGLSVAAVFAISWLVIGRVSRPVATAAVTDTSRYVILPFAREAGIGSLNEGELLQDALTRWSGISIVDPFQVRDALARRAGPVRSGADAREVALGLGAGRYLRGAVSRVGDSIRVYVALFETSGGALLRDDAVRLPPSGSHPEAAFEALSDRLLFGSAGPGPRPEARTGTRSLPARQAFARGQAAVYDWDLAGADSAFAAATRDDPAFAQAFVWLAQVRVWAGAQAPSWRSAAERAGAGRPRLSSRDQLLSDGLVALGRGDVARACETWGRLIETDQHDFAAWYGLGHCLSHDDVVFRDVRSPSGWRFRSSYRRAAEAYQRAFQLLPSIHKALSGGSFSWVREMLMTRHDRVRPGRAIGPDTTTFWAYPSWEGDTLAFVPYPRQVLAGAWAGSNTTNTAIRHQREVFRDIALGWVTAFPRSASALEALGIALEMLGDPSAVDTLRRARTLASAPAELMRVATDEAWLRVKLAVPADLQALGAARALADSVVEVYAKPATRELLLVASLASLTGRAGLAAAFARHPTIAAEAGIPTPLNEDAYPILIFAALGGPIDSLRALETRVDSTIETAVVAPRRQEQRMEWLARPATLAFPVYRFKSIPDLVGAGDYLLDAEAAFMRSDTVALRRKFGELHAARRYWNPEDLTLDTLYPEAWMLAALGDDRAAIAWIDPTLDALLSSPPEIFLDPPNAGALVRAMALRAELAARVGDRAGSARWARVVSELWANADPFLQPVVTRMRQLAGRGS